MHLFEYSNSLNSDKPLSSYMASSLRPPVFSEMNRLFQTQWANCPYGFEFWAEPCSPEANSTVT